MSSSRSRRIVQMVTRMPNQESLSEEDLQFDGSDYIPSSANTSQSLSFDWENFSPTRPASIDGDVEELKIYEELTPVKLDDLDCGAGSSEKCSIEQKKQKRNRRKHYCLYCNLQTGNFSRHLERNHMEEFEVQKFMSLKKKSKERQSLLNKLRREGDFSSAKIIPVKNTQTENVTHIPCIYCRGYYCPKTLRRHVKKCAFNPDPTKRCKAQVQGQTMMAGRFGPNDPLRVSGILDMMRADHISLVAKKDLIICEVARRYIKSHKEKHLLQVAKRYMRRLAKLLLGVRKIDNNPKLQMTDILCPHYFARLVRATKDIAEYNAIERTYASPSLALQMGTLIKAAINSLYSIEIQKKNYSDDRLQQLKSLTTLIETDWAQEISSEAGQNLNVNKFNKPTLIPMAEDIKKLENYLDEKMQECKNKLLLNPTLKDYKTLQEVVFCSVLLLNKRRVGELQRLSLSGFLNNSGNTTCSELERALTPTEKILYNSLKRVVIRGKRGRGVPVLFEKKTLGFIEILLKYRPNFDLSENTYLFGTPGGKNCIYGYKVMRSHVTIALKAPEKVKLLTSTKLRKHLAMMSQIFRMEKNDLEQLANFMGHTGKTHSEFYRLPDDVYQTAKVSKLLLLSKSGFSDEHKGKKLQDIELNLNDIEEDNGEVGLDLSDVSDEEGNGVIGNTRINSSENNITPDTREKVVLCSKKRKLVPWTSEQKKLTEKFFAKHIRSKIPPKKGEVMKLIGNNPGVFDNKTWPVIKVYVCNKFKA